MRKLASLFQSIVLAISFLTRLPVTRLLATTVDQRHQGNSLVWYPWVGLLLAGLIALLIIILPPINPLLLAALIVTLWVLLTGALHIDGLADSMDAWFAGHANPEKTLLVFKDPATGVMGLVAVVLMLLLKFAAIVALLANADSSVIWVLAAAMLLGRVAALVLMLTTPYAREQGYARRLLQSISRPAGWCSVALAIFTSIFVLSTIISLASIFMALLAVLLAACFWRAMWFGRIGGFTGDTAGALIEITETLVLTIVVILSATSSLSL